MEERSRPPLSSTATGPPSSRRATLSRSARSTMRDASSRVAGCRAAPTAAAPSAPCGPPRRPAGRRPGHRVDVPQQGARGVDVPEAQVLGDVIEGEIAADPGQLEQRRQLGGEGDPAPGPGPVEGPGAHGVPGEEQGLLLPIPQGQGEVPLDPAQLLRAPLPPPVQQRLDVVGVQAPVEGEDGARPDVGPAPVARREGEFPLDEHRRPLPPPALVVAAPVATPVERLGLVAQGRRAREVDDARDAAQGGPSGGVERPRIPAGTGGA